jgi:hypothetical protein
VNALRAGRVCEFPLSSKRAAVLDRGGGLNDNDLEDEGENILQG